MTIESTENKSIIHKILGLNQHLVSFAVLCYMTGFAITNLYLGSFGIANFDVIRVRYILTGLLFIAFLGIIVFPLYGLIHVLRNQDEKSIVKIISSVFYFTLIRYSVIYFAVMAIVAFASGVKSPIIRDLIDPSGIDWENWLSSQPSKIFLQSLRFVITYPIVLGLVAVILVIIIIAINPKNRDGIRTPRREALQEIFKNIRANFKKGLFEILKYLVLAFLFLFTANISLSLVSILGDGSNILISFNSEGWAMFLGLAFLIYVIVGSYLLFTYLTHKPSDSENNNSLTKDDPLDKFYSLIYVLALGILLIVPVYAFSIYPRLPQQVGGGNAVVVKVFTNDELSPTFTNPDTKSYLLDRTSKSALFLVFDEKQQTVIEVPESQIKSIVYEPPQLSATNTPTSTVPINATPTKPILTTSTPIP